MWSHSYLFYLVKRRVNAKIKFLEAINRLVDDEKFIFTFFKGIARVAAERGKCTNIS